MAMSLISVLFIMSVSRKLNNHVSNVSVMVKPIKGDKDMISAEEVKSMLTNYLGYDVSNSNIREINTREIEELFGSDKRVKKVEIFLDSKDRLNIWIIQRQPVVRVMDSKDVSYYIDEDGQQIPAIKNAAIRVPLATGNIELFDSTFYNVDKKSRLRDIYTVSKYIAGDDFLSSLIEQINVDDNKELVLIPKIGRQKIILGDASVLDEKFANLKVMYRQGLPREGWRKFSVLNINYKGQVVGTKDQTL